MIIDMQDYKSSLSDTASRRFETFSYLPPMSLEQIQKQIEYMIAKGWNPGVEHTEPQHVASSYWYMWKLPLFGETDVKVVLAECAACHQAHPDNHVRLVGFDNDTQSIGLSLVVYRGKPA